MVAWAVGSEWRTRPKAVAGFLLFVRRSQKTTSGGTSMRLPRERLQAQVDERAYATRLRALVVAVRQPEGDRTGPVLNTIKPYWYDGAWVFDDLTRRLWTKPLVARAPAVVDQILREAGLPPRQPFALTFSDRDAFRLGYRFVLEWVRDDREGTWYRWSGTEALWPGLLRYFDAPLARIHCQVRARRTPFSIFHTQRGERPQDSSVEAKETPILLAGHRPKEW